MPSPWIPIITHLDARSNLRYLHDCNFLLVTVAGQALSPSWATMPRSEKLPPHSPTAALPHRYERIISRKSDTKPCAESQHLVCPTFHLYSIYYDCHTCGLRLGICHFLLHNSIPQNCNVHVQGEHNSFLIFVPRRKAFGRYLPLHEYRRSEKGFCGNHCSDCLLHATKARHRIACRISWTRLRYSS